MPTDAPVTCCPECARLREAYLQAVRNVGQLAELLDSTKADDPHSGDIRQELQKADDLRVASREAKVNHPATHEG